MRLRILFLLLLMFGSVSAYADDVRRTVINAATVDSLGAIVSTIAVPTTATVYTKSISLINHGYEGIGVMYKATSAGTIAVTVQAQRSYAPPASESAYDAAYVDWNTSSSTTDNTWRMATLDTVIMPYLRFKISGTGSNAASTTMQVKVEQQ